MLLGRLLPDASYPILRDGWTRHAYRPRHGKPPLIVRAGLAAVTTAGAARERYLGSLGLAGDDEGASGQRTVLPARTAGQPVR